MRNSCTMVVQLLALSCYAQEIVEQETYLKIGGIEQWVSIKGKHSQNPIVLFIHGGPGSPMSPYADSVFQGWLENFMVVNWDQRGAG